MRGSCHCGTVRYEVDRLGPGLGNCYCITCRKTHAAAYVTTTRIARDDFRWLSGQDRLTAYHSSPGKIRYFCAGCGCHIVADRADQPYLILRAATLDDDPGLRPVLGIWHSQAAAWCETDAAKPLYAEALPAR